MVRGCAKRPPPTQQSTRRAQPNTSATHKPGRLRSIILGSGGVSFPLELGVAVESGTVGKVLVTLGSY